MCRQDVCTTIKWLFAGSPEKKAFHPRDEIRADTKVRPYNNSLTLTLSQREREIILLSSFSQGLHHGLYSCHAVGAEKTVIHFSHSSITQSPQNL